MSKRILIVIYILSTLILFTGCSKAIQNGNVFSEADAIALVLKDFPQFPDRVGEVNSTEVITGGLYPGLCVKVDFTTEVIKQENNKFTVKLIKQWNFEINGLRPVSYWTYEVEPDYMVLVDTYDMDYFVPLVK